MFHEVQFDLVTLIAVIRRLSVSEDAIVGVISSFFGKQKRMLTMVLFFEGKRMKFY
jgi:hypothetical protein